MLRSNAYRRFFRHILSTYVECVSCKSTSPVILSSKVGNWKRQPCMAIRRETINAWERRAPLSPKHVKQLTKSGVKVLIQPSNRRAYTMQDYIAAGAVPAEDISQASLIMSVKSVPVEELIPGKTYVFFSHTIKAQKDNMPLLDTVLQRNIRLIDYEKMVDARGQRLVAFGKWAGYAGMINILHGLGLRLLALGHNTPFLHIGLAHNYRDSHMAQNAIRDAGYEIALGLMPHSLGPLTFVFSGTGNVSQGAQEIFNSLPTEYVDVANLAKVAQHGSLNKVYGCVVSREDHLIRKEGGGFDPEEYDAHPERYTSTFAKQVAPYTSVLINGIYWAPNSPRLITLPDAKDLLRHSGKITREVPGCPTLRHRLLAICDISADPGGSIEFMTECTTIDRPFCIYDADQHISHDSFDLPMGVLVCSIDNMPAQMPLEATDYFGDLLLRFVWEMLESDASKSFDEFDCSPSVKNAVIASNGRLTAPFEYITELRKKQQMASAHKVGKMPIGERHKVLVLGAGFVSGPVVDYLCRNNDFDVTVATALQEDVDKLMRLSPYVQPEIIDVLKETEKLEQLVDANDLVISLLPYTLHPSVAKMCIKYKSNMITASYLSPEMKELHKAAKEAGVTIVNEVGLDPGIDHLLAMELIDSVHAQGGKVTSFISWCGGLPAPESSENPLRYKFSWSPRAVLLNVLSSAKYMVNGKNIDIPSGGLLDNIMDLDFMPGFNLEGYPNRDSTLYAPLYNLSHCNTLLRGTLRYKGFGEAMKGLLAVKLIDPNPHQAFDPDSGPNVSWKHLLASLMNLKPDIFIGSLRSKVAEHLGGENSPKFKAIEGLGLFNDHEVVSRKYTPLDTLSHYLVKKLTFGTQERDLCLMRHDVKILWPNNTEEIHHVDLVAYGEPNGFSAMASTVGYTTAIVAKMVLEGEIQKRGMVLPMSQDIYRPVLKRLNQEGIVSRNHRTLL